MAGNRKHGFRKSIQAARTGWRSQAWFCHGCEKMHPYRQFRNGVLVTGKSYCDRTYYKLPGVQL